jgi:hypothetical protein
MKKKIYWPNNNYQYHVWTISRWNFDPLLYKNLHAAAKVRCYGQSSWRQKSYS